MTADDFARSGTPALFAAAGFPIFECRISLERAREIIALARSAAQRGEGGRKLDRFDPLAVVDMPSASARLSTARTIATLSGSTIIPDTKLRSILSTSIGRRCR